MKYRFYKKLTRLLIVPMLSASLIATVLPAGAGSLEVKAEEISQNGIENGNIENSDIENSDTGFAADKLNYVYLENKTVTSPGTQTVMTKSLRRLLPMERSCRRKVIRDLIPRIFPCRSFHSGQTEAV